MKVKAVQIETKQNKETQRNFFLAGLGLVLLFYFLLHIFTKELLLDDGYLEEFYGTNRLFDALKLRYDTWTSRVVIEFVAALIMRCPFFVWQILDTLMYGVIYACLWILMRVKGKNSIFLGMAVCSYILLQMASAGWQITSITYVGTMATALLCGVILKKRLDGVRTGIWEYGLYVICMVYTCNYEIMAVTMLAASLLLLPGIWKTAQGRLEYFSGLLIQLGSVFFIWQTPGNQIRLNLANVRYEGLTVLDKIRLGIVSTFQHFVSIPNVLFGALCLILVFAAWENRFSVRDKVLACIPLVIDGILTVYYLMHDIILGGKRNYVFEEADLIPSSGAVWAEQILLILCCLAVVSATVYTLNRLVGCREEFYMLLIMLSLGCASRMAMAFTSSLFESGTRTFLELYFVLAGVVGAMMQYVNSKWFRRGMAAVLAAGMGINAVLTVIPYLQNYS